jgi:hypothetical protein
MAQFEGLLMRDSLQDNGTVPSPGYPYYSPDVICHVQVASPQTYFVDNYSQNPNQPAQLGSQVNFIYARAKNLATAVQNGWYIHVYRSSPSLFMTPSVWKNNPLNTQAGNPYVTLGSLQPNQIGVASTNFLLSGLSSSYFCLIGVASPTATPSIPDSFATYGDYVLWVRTNPNVCGNNLTVLQTFPNQQWDRLDNFSNPTSNSVPTMITVEVQGNLPGNTSYGLRCAPLNINASTTVGQSTQLSASGFTPPKFNGSVETWGSLASPGSWPPNVILKTTVYVGIQPDDPAAMFAEPWERFPADARERLKMESTGYLILVGTTGTAFVT